MFRGPWVWTFPPVQINWTIFILCMPKHLPFASTESRDLTSCDEAWLHYWLRASLSGLPGAIFFIEKNQLLLSHFGKRNLGHAEQFLLLRLNRKSKDSKIVLSCRQAALSSTSLWQLLSTGLFRENTIWPGCGKIQWHTLVPDFVEFNP